VIAGRITAGIVRAGMFLRIPASDQITVALRIHSIEMARREGGREDVCLCITANPETVEFLRSARICNQSFEITSDGFDLT
jgi:hypothetical protein